MKNQIILIDALGIETGRAVTSEELYQRFAAVLVKGTSATLVVETSENGSSGWTVAGTFSLDTVGEKVVSELIKVEANYVRARVTAMAGGTPRVLAWMG